MSTADPNRPLDLSWEEPLPHALTQTRTYLSRPSCSTQVAIVAIHGKGDSARDFADAFVPHLQSYFGSHLQGEVDNGAVSSAETESCQGGVRVTLRALEALDGIWFGTHLRESPPPFRLRLDAHPRADSERLTSDRRVQRLNSQRRRRSSLSRALRTR